VSDGSTVVYFYDGTLEGFFSAVFDAYTHPIKPDIIAVEDNFQQQFDQITLFIQTEQHKYSRVYEGIKEHLGPEGYNKVKTVFLTRSPDKDTLIYHYLVHGFKVGRRIHNDLTHEAVTPIEYLFREMWRETHQIIQFARFARMDNGVYFSKVKPKHNVVPLVMDHFARRFNVQPFMIYDEANQLAGIYDMKRWYLQYVDDIDIPDCATDDRHYQKLWKAFYDAIAIEERVNHKQRRTFMPMRFWSNLTEMTYIDREESATPALNTSALELPATQI
jgi:probable DNA metabolism protein